MAGTYEFAGDMCPDRGGSALCIDRNVTIEAEVAGSVVLDAKGARRVIYVSTSGRAELVGLNITGGDADYVSFLASIEPMHTRDIPSPPGSSHFHSIQGGGILINIRGSASLTDCNFYDSVASIVSVLLKSNPWSRATLEGCVCSWLAGWRGTLHRGHGNADQHQRLR